MRVELDHEIAAPVERVFAVVSDITQRPKWVGIAHQRTQIGDGPVGAGTQFKAVDRMPGRTMGYTQTIDRVDENRLFEESWDGPMGGRSAIRFEDNNGATSLNVEADVALPVPGFLAPLAKRWALRSFRQDMERLNQLVTGS